MKTKNKTILLLAVFIASQILWSCSPVKIANIEKRRYMDGYYVNIIKGNNNTKTKLIERKSIDNALVLATDVEQKKDNYTKQYVEESVAVPKEMNNQDVVSNQIVSSRNNKPTAENQKKPVIMINKKKLKNEIRKNIKQALAYNSSLKSINNTDTDSEELIMMIVGGASAVTGALLLNSGPLMYLMIFGGIGISILGLFLILVGFENL